MQFDFRLISTLVVVGAAYSGHSSHRGVHDPAGPCSGHCPAHPGKESLVLVQRHSAYLSMNRTVDTLHQLPSDCRRASDNTVWCASRAGGSVTGNDLCGYSSGYSDYYYPATQAAADAWGVSISWSDCATNYFTGQNSMYGSDGTCDGSNGYSNQWKWGRTDGGLGPFVRCTNRETPSPTLSPTLSPTASPTASPTQAPTASPTASPTQAPTASPTASPTQAPTLSPTLSPTASAPVSASGDPHLINLRGERFDVNKVGLMEFLRIPYESVTEKANFTVLATIEDVRGSVDECKRALYITSARFGGAWLGDRDVEVSMNRGEMVVSRAGVRMKPSPQPVPIGSMLQLHFPREDQLHVHIGAASIDISHDIQQAHFFLNMRAASLGNLGYKIGGLLGEDTHDHVSKAPSKCHLSLLAAPREASRSVASASLGPN